MKMPIVIMLVMALAGAAASGGHPENIITESSVRSFQHENGKTVRARVAAFKPESNKVTLAREDRRTFSVDLGVFSEADRTYVREWHSIKDFFRQDGLHISASRRPVRGDVEHLIWRSEETVVYDITLENRCDFDMNDLTLEYTIYYRVNEPNIPEPNADQGFKGGRLNIQRLAAGEQIRVNTLPVSFPTEDLFEYYRDGKAPAVKLLGIRLRVYLPLDSGRKAMREFASPDALLKTRKWVSPGESRAPNS
jgi:hypothetical protein